MKKLRTMKLSEEFHRKFRTLAGSRGMSMTEYSELLAKKPSIEIEKELLTPIQDALSEKNLKKAWKYNWGRNK